MMIRKLLIIMMAVLMVFISVQSGVCVFAETTEADEQIFNAEPSDSEINANTSARLSDITNFNQIAEAILWLAAPCYLEDDTGGNYIKSTAYGYEEYYSKVNKYASLDTMRAHYEQMFSDIALNKLVRIGGEFAIIQNALYSRSIGIGYGGFAAEEAKLERVASNGDYIVSIPKYNNLAYQGTPQYYNCVFRKKNGTFYVADFTSVPDGLQNDPVIGYATVNANGIYSCKSRSTSDKTAYVYNKGAIVDVYEIVKEGNTTWYRILRNDSAYVTPEWIPGTGNNVKFTSWLKDTTFLNGQTIEIYAGDTIKLTSELLSGGLTASWTTSSSSIASVGSTGSVKGIKPGTATIKASLSNGSQSSCTIRVRFTDIAKKTYFYDPVYWAVNKGITNGYTDSDNIVRTFKPKNNCTREAVVTFLWRLAGKPEPNNMNSPFSDVQDRGKYYYKAVLWAAEKGIAKGYSNGTFRPGDTCLREHVVTFLWRYAKSPNPQTSRNPFNDVRTSDYFYKAAIWANENGIAKGYTSGVHAGGFGPKLDCLREHVVTFLYRYAK